MTDLPERLRIKASMIELGERIAWGSDSALMREAADALEMAAPAVQGELGVKWAPEEVANGNKGIRWVSDEGVHGRPTDHDCRVYLESNPNARGCHCPECTKLYTAAQTAEEIGEVVVTKDKVGNIVSVTRQDAEGRVLSVIAESDRCDDNCDAAEQQREPCHECGGNGAGGEHEEDCSQQPTPDVAMQVMEALAAILRKAQGRTDTETGECIDIGAECMAIRREFDRRSKAARGVNGLLEAASAALDEIEDIMHEAYNSAYPVCCGRAGSECCGSPEPEWSEFDKNTMDRLAPHQRALTAALAAYRKGGEA